MCFIDYKKAFDCVDHERLWVILKEMGVPIHLIVLLRNLYTKQEATIRTEFGETDTINIGKGVYSFIIYIIYYNTRMYFTPLTV